MAHTIRCSAHTAPRSACRFMRWEGHGITCAEKLAGPGDKEARPRRQQRLRADDVLGGRAARSGGHDVDLLTPRT